MAGKFEGRVFLVDSNNGVTALVTEDDAEAMSRAYQVSCMAAWKGKERGDDQQVKDAVRARLQPKPLILTFASIGRVTGDEDHQSQPWFTGSIELDLQDIVDYIRLDGGEVKQGSFYVPFSNGLEWGTHGLEGQLDELGDHVVMPAEFRALFGLSLDQIREVVRRHRAERLRRANEPRGCDPRPGSHEHL